MVKTAFSVLTLASALAIAGCSDSTSAACVRNSECAAGNYCSAGSCTSDCTAATVADDCATGEMCSSFGMCVAPPDGGQPDLGTSPTDAGVDAPDSRPACVIAGGVDADGDGYCVEAATDADCDDSDATRNPAASEVCTASDALLSARAVDEDCDGAIDEDCGWFFGTPHPVLIGAADATNWGVESPRLSADGLRLYVRGGRAAATDPRAPLMLERASVDAKFGAPTVVGIGAVPTYVSSIGLSRDELEIYLQVPGGASAMDLYKATRAVRTAAFTAPVAVSELNSPSNDFHPVLRNDGLELLYVSARSGVPRLYRATRPSRAAATWSAPEALVLGATPSVVGEASPALSSDGLVLFFGRDLAAGRAVFMATRASRNTSTFGPPVELTSLNQTGRVTVFPEISERTAEIFFVSDRDWSPGASDGQSLWRARICRDGPCGAAPIPCDSAVRSPDGLSCYFATGAPSNYGTARTACASMGAHVVDIHSAAEQALVWSTFGGSAGSVTLWTSLEETSTVDVFAWGNGTPLVYTNWFPGEPNPGAGEACAALYAPSGAAGRWVDINCITSVQAVCETDLWPTW